MDRVEELLLASAALRRGLNSSLIAVVPASGAGNSRLAM